MNEYDPILAKARALAALADPANGGEPGEVSNAQAALSRLLERNERLQKALADNTTSVYHLDCISPRRRDKPVKSKNLARLAQQCLQFVTGDAKRRVYIEVVDYFTPSKGMRPDKKWSIYGVQTECTASEFEEWRACFNHYAPHFLETLMDLKAEAKAANAAVRMCLSGFCHRHSIFGPSEGDGKALSPEKMAALMAAMMKARGSAFAGALKQLPPAA